MVCQLTFSDLYSSLTVSAFSASACKGGRLRLIYAEDQAQPLQISILSAQFKNN